MGVGRFWVLPRTWWAT